MVKNLEVRKALLENNLQIKDVAEKIGYTRGHISGVISGRYDSPKVKISIAMLLGRDYDSLWNPDPSEDEKQPH